MNKGIIGFLCVLVTVASAQSDCMQALQVSLPQLMKMYNECSEMNWINFETDLEKFIPTAQMLLANCADYNITDSPRVQACISNGEGIARLIAPILMDPEDTTALYKLLFQLPGYLSAFYGQCINPPEIKTDHDYVTALMEDKAREGDIFGCVSSAIALVQDIKKLVSDISNVDIMAIIHDLSAINAQYNAVCTACGLSDSIKLFETRDVEHCFAHLTTVYQIAESLLSANDDIPKMLQGIKALFMLVPVALSGCGIQF